MKEQSKADVFVNRKDEIMRQRGQKKRALFLTTQSKINSSRALYPKAIQGQTLQQLGQGFNPFSGYCRQYKL